MADELREALAAQAFERVPSTLTHRTRALIELTEQPGWEILKEEVAAAEQEYLLAIARRIPRVLAQEKLDLVLAHRKGYFDGIKSILEEPEHTLNNFESAWKRAWDDIVQEFEEAAGEQSPYVS